jgi:hypothetical protein
VVGFGASEIAVVQGGGAVVTVDGQPQQHREREQWDGVKELQPPPPSLFLLPLPRAHLKVFLKNDSYSSASTSLGERVQSGLLSLATFQSQTCRLSLFITGSTVGAAPSASTALALASSCRKRG